MKKIIFLSCFTVLLAFVIGIQGAYSGKNDYDAFKDNLLDLELKCNKKGERVLDDIAVLDRKKKKRFGLFKKAIKKKLKKKWAEYHAIIDKCMKPIRKQEKWYNLNKKVLKQRKEFKDGCGKNFQNCQLRCVEKAEKKKQVDDQTSVLQRCGDKCEKFFKKCIKAVDKHNPLVKVKE